MSTEPMVLTLTLPLPPRDCSSNGNKGSWRKKAIATADYRAEAGIWGRDAVWKGWKAPEKARMSLVFSTRGTRGIARYAPRDISNAISAFKGAQDGLVDAGCLVADDAKHLVLGEVTIDTTQGPFVTVTLEAIDG